MNRLELARELGLKPRQIDNLAAEGMPRRKVGRTWAYGSDAVGWYWKRKAEQIGSVKRGELDAAKMRRELANAELAELELAARRRSQFLAEDVFREFGHVAELFRARVLALPRHAHRVQAVRTYAEAHALLEELGRELLEVIQSDLLEGVRDSGRGASTRRRGRPRGPGRPRGAGRGRAAASPAAAQHQ